MSEALKKAYASMNGDVVYAVRLLHSGLTGGARAFIDAPRDQVATLENGEQITFEATGMRLSLPPNARGGNQNISFALSNVSLEAYKEIKRVKDKDRDEARAGQKAERIWLELRAYLIGDWAAPKAYTRVLVKNTKVDLRTVTIQASYLEMANVEWPLRRFYIADYPGVKYA